MNRHGFTRRGFLQGSTLAAAAASPQSGTPERRDYTTHRTQFDAQLLAESYDPLLVANHGRHVRISLDGSVRTALAWGGDKPRVRLYKNRELAEEYLLNGSPSAPVLTAEDVWYSVGTDVYRGRQHFPGIQGKLLDAATASGGATVLALSAEGRLELALMGTKEPKLVAVDEGAGRTSLEFDSSGALHVAYERRQGIEHRIFENGLLRQSERPAEAFGFHPVLLAYNGDMILAYLGESCRVPSIIRGSEAWERLGRGGYVAALIRHAGRWLRCRLANSRPFSKALYPNAGDADIVRRYDSNRIPLWSEVGSYSEGVNRRLINHMEEFSPPAVGVGGDGVVQVLWSDNERRWIYGARLVGDEFTPLQEIRGPLEQVTGPCLIARNAAGSQGTPLAMVTCSRVYLDRIALPSSEVVDGKRIDFITPDELAQCRGLEFCVNQMQRRPENPVAAALSDATSSAMAMSRTRNRVPSVEDPTENNPAHRFKGFTRDPEYPGFDWLPVASPDGITWERVPHSRPIVRCDSPMRVWIDPDDVPARRYKVNGIGRSFCGRIAVQFTSPNGIDWNDERDTLDFQDPFRSQPDPNPTGRILLDSWSGPEDEAELHGGFVFRDGDRWLLHYMKWTPDGHIYCALAASRDGLNFSRVGGGAVTLPLGEAGTWDAGRVAISQPPFIVGNLWRQYYSGCGWKHGMAGIGGQTSQMGSAYSPMQTGAAEIPVGHWVHLRTRREAEEGEIATVPLRLTRAHSLKVDSEGDTLKVAIFDPMNGRELPGFGFAEFDPLATTNTATWRGKSLESVGARTIQLRVRLIGPRVKLYSIRLVGRD